MQKVKTTTQLFRRSTVAFALLSALAGQAAIAAVSTNTVGPIHGRQIVMDGAPTVAGDAIVGTQMNATVPGVTDADGDALEDWKYIWKVDGEDVGVEADAGSISAIPAFTVRAQDAGKKLELCLRAVAEVRSFPVETRYSEAQCSTEIDLIAATLDITDPGVLTVAENDAYTLALAATSNNPNANLEWALDGGADAALFSINPATGELTMAAKDFEAPADSDTNNTYVVTVKVTDSVSGATTSMELTVTVTNVVETATSVEVVDGAGVVISGNPLVGTVLHSKVTLDDGQGAVTDRTDATYQWQRNGSAVGQPNTWVDIVGATGATYTVTAEDQGYEVRVDANGK